MSQPKTVTEKRWADLCHWSDRTGYILGPHLSHRDETREMMAKRLNLHKSWLVRVTITYEVPRG